MDSRIRKIVIIVVKLTNIISYPKAILRQLTWTWPLPEQMHLVLFLRVQKSIDITFTDCFPSPSKKLLTFDLKAC